jgi:hypothetical protein
MTPKDITDQMLQILRQMTNIASDLQAHADELTRLQMAATRQHQVKARPQTNGNIVILPGVSLEAARRAQQRNRRRSSN